MADPDQFKASLAKWLEHAKGQQKKFIATFCLDFSAEVQGATPVKTGNLRSAWRAQVNADPGPNGSISPGSAASGMQFGDTFYLVNYTQYAAAVEFGSKPHAINPKGPPEGATVLHWKAGGKDFFAQHVWHPGYVGAAFVRGVMARADDIAQGVANKLGTSDSNVVGGS